MQVLCVHGRGGGLLSTPDESVSALRWAFPESPAVAPFWTQRRFAEQVGVVDTWLEASELAVGQGYGAWLLLAAAELRVTSGRGFPPLVLWNPPLGEARHLNGALVGYRAPRAARVREALGMDREHRGAILPTARVAFVFDADNRQATAADAECLRRVGFDIRVVGRGAAADDGTSELCLRALVARFAEEQRLAQRMRAVAAAQCDDAANAADQPVACAALRA